MNNNNAVVENVFEKHLAQFAYRQSDRQAYELAKEQTKKELGLKKVAIKRDDALKQRIAEKIKVRRGQKTFYRDTIDFEKRLHSMIVKKATPMLQQCAYRRSQSTWAGGDTTFQVQISKDISASGSGDKVWSSNGKWSGLDAYYNFSVLRSWLRKVFKENLANVDGLFTLDADKVDENSHYTVYRASWVEQSRGFGVKIEQGYIVRLANGETAHGKTIRSALNALAKRKNFDQMKVMKQTIIPELYPNVRVTFRDSTDSGNCRPGTESWKQSHFPNKKSVTVGELLSVDGNNPLVRRACEMAIRKRLVREKIKNVRKEMV